MIKTKSPSLQKVLQILGKEVLTLLFLSFLLGIFLFFIEFLFAYAVQGFLAGIGVFDLKVNKIPNWIPHHGDMAIYFFMLVGMARSTGLIIKNYIGNMANQIFLKTQRTQILHFSIHNATKTSSNRMIDLFTDTLSRAGSLIIQIATITTTLTSITFLLILGLKIAPREMVISSFLLLLFIFPFHYLNDSSKFLGHKLSETWNEALKKILEGIKHHYFIKGHGLISQYTNEGKNLINEYAQTYKRFFFFSSLKSGAPNFFGILTVAIIGLLSKHYFPTSPSDFIAFLYIFLRLSQGSSEIAQLSNELKINYHALEKLVVFNEDMAHFNEKEKIYFEEDLPFNLQGQTISLKIENLSFGFNNRPLFSNLSLSLAEGEILHIRGESGVGKSTLISLLLGINRPMAGHITVNDQSLYSIIHALYQHMAYVGPDPFIFQGTIRENLCLGNSRHINDQELIETLQTVRLMEFLESKEGGLNFVLNEHSEASSGQKQRLALARAILRNPKILILDEATANVDKETEEIIMDTILKKFSTAITFLISHKTTMSKYATVSLHLMTNQKFTLERS